MSWLLEDPTLVLVTGAIVLVLLGVALAKTGRGAILLGMVGVAVLVAALVVVEWVVVTQRERVESTLYGITKALEANMFTSITSCRYAKDSPWQAMSRNRPQPDLALLKTVTGTPIRYNLCASKYPCEGRPFAGQGVITKRLFLLFA